MDFTKVYNDGEGIEKVPKSVIDLIRGSGYEYELSSCAVRTSDAYGNTTYEVGIRDAGENMNEAPSLRGDYSFMIEVMEKFKNGDDEGADEGFVKLMHDVPEVNRDVASVRRNPIARSETNAEMCLFNTRDLESEAQSWGYNGIAMLNPSIGTIKRYSEVYPKSSVPVFITEADSDYVRRISNLCSSLRLSQPMCVGFSSLDPKYVYYGGFRVDNMRYCNSERNKKGFDCLEYVGFVPNLLAMACAEVDVLSYSEFDQRFVYLRKSEEISVDMHPHRSMIRADALSYDWSKLRYFKRSQGIMHDLVSSLDWDVQIPVIKARPIPVGAVVPYGKGEIKRRSDGLYLSGKRIVDINGVRVPHRWKVPENLADHRYISGEFHGAIYDAGKVIRVECMTLREMADRETKLFNEGVDVNEVHNTTEMYREDPNGSVRLRENRKGPIRYKKRNYNREIVSNYCISIETVIQYTGGRIEMYGIKHIDMTEGNLDLKSRIKSGDEIEFGYYI